MMDVTTPDDTTPTDGICLRERAAPADRLFESAFGIAALLAGIITFALTDYVFAVAALLLGGLLLHDSFRKSDVAWIVRNGNVLIEERRAWSRPRTRMIRRDDISDVHVQESENSNSTPRLALRLATGDLLISPPIPDGRRSGASSTRMIRQFGFRDAALTSHETDAANAGIRLGRPVSTAIGRANRILALILAAAVSVPYAFKIWHGEPLNVGEILLIPALLIFVGARIIYAYRLCGTLWIITQGEIRIEWLSMKGRLCADTVKGSDIQSISIGPPKGGWDEENRKCALHIRSHNGQVLRSPEIGDERTGLAMLADIGRKLGVEPSSRRS